MVAIQCRRLEGKWQDGTIVTYFSYSGNFDAIALIKYINDLTFRLKCLEYDY